MGPFIASTLSHHKANFRKIRCLLHSASQFHFFSLSELKDPLTFATFKRSDFATLILQTAISCHESPVEYVGSKRIVHWDIPEVLLNTRKIPTTAVIWCLRLILLHFGGISFDSSRIFVDIQREPLCIIDYEMILDFFLERHDQLLRGSRAKASIIIPKIRRMQVEYKDD